MIRNFKFDYDRENDDLFLYDPKSRSKASIELDDLIVDFNAKNEISGIELLNATAFFKGLDSNGVELTKESLSEIKDCKIEIISKSSFFVIKFMLSFGKDRNFSTPIIVPTIAESSPALIGA